MAKETTKGEITHENKILRALLDDPTRSLRDIAKNLNTYRQKIWRVKKGLEEDKVIWGYTGILDETKLGHGLYIIMMKLKPMDKDLATLMSKRIGGREQKKQNVNLLTMYYVNGEYDYIVVFSAPDHSIARRYYDSIRVAYDEYLLEKPVIQDVNFCLIREGKVNPDLPKLQDFVPI